IADPMAPLRRVVPAMQVAAGFFFLSTLLDWTITVLPMRPGEATWRYGAFGLLSQYMPSLATSLAVIVVGGFLLSQRRFMMILAIVGGTLTACYLVMVGVWSLDVLQARPQVPVE